MENSIFVYCILAFEDIESRVHGGFYYFIVFSVMIHICAAVIKVLKISTRLFSCNLVAKQSARNSCYVIVLPILIVSFLNIYDKLNFQELKLIISKTIWKRTPEPRNIPIFVILRLSSII